MEEIALDDNVVLPVKDMKPVVAAPRGRTLRNAIFRFGAQFAAILLNLLATPYIVRQLGVEAYGVVGVINTMLAFMSIGTVSFTSTVGRNLTFAVEREEYEQANREISTAFFGLLRLFAWAFLPLCVMSMFIDKLVVIPAHMVPQARIFFVLAVCSFGFTTMAGPVGAAMFVRNRLDLFSCATLGRTIFFIAAIVALFNAMGAGLASYGAALLIASLLQYRVHLRLHRHLLPVTEISRRWFDRTILRGIMSLGGWMTVNQIGALLFLQTDLLVANRVLGAAAAGQLAAISVVSLQLRSVASLVAGLFAPNQAALAARDDRSSFSRYLFRSIRLNTLFMAVLVGVFCGSAREVLSLWLGKQFASLAPVAIMLTSYLIITLGLMPCWNAVLAIGKVKVPAIVTLVMGGANVALAIVLAGRMGVMGIAVSGCIMLTLRNTLFTPWYVSRSCGISLWAICREMAFGVASGGLVYAVTATVISWLQPQTRPMLLFSLTVSTLLVSVLLLPLVWSNVRKIPQRA